MKPLSVPRQALMGVVRGYRYWLKPWIGNVCRFEPSCSEYALQALQVHGAVRGSALAAGRLLRCHPWCDGGHDPVPAHVPSPALAGRGLFTRLLHRPPADAARRAETTSLTRKIP